jgi:hypothetical protein
MGPAGPGRGGIQPSMVTMMDRPPLWRRACWWCGGALLCGGWVHLWLCCEVERERALLRLWTGASRKDEKVCG